MVIIFQPSYLTTAKSISPLKGKVDLYQPAVELSMYGVSGEEIRSVTMLINGKTMYNPYVIEGDNLRFVVREPLLNDATIVIKLFLKNRNLLRIQGMTQSLPQLKESNMFELTPTSKVCRANVGQSGCHAAFVPAQPEKGFNFPYMLYVPQGYDKRVKTTLLVEPLNLSDMSYPTYLGYVKRTEQRFPLTFLGHSISNNLKIPFMVPIIPNYNVWFDGFEAQYKNVTNNLDAFATQSLDRSSMLLDHSKIESLLADVNFRLYIETGGMTEFELRRMERIDLQLGKMIEHAQSLFTQSGGVIDEKIFMTGFSSSSKFADRWSMLYPDRVRAVGAGAISSLPMLPLTSYKGKNLIYPIGTYDYKSLTGREFDLNNYKKVARFYFQGQLDQSDTLGYPDVFGPLENELIRELFTGRMYPDRWNISKSIYKQIGMDEIFKLYPNLGHTYNEEVIVDLTQFFKDQLQ
jgi:hypothetical protein